MNLDWNSGALAQGLECYQRQQFFQAHEHWESVWLACPQPEKSFLQALIQMAAAFHHLQRHNHRGAASLLSSALRKLERYPPQFSGVEVGLLRQQIAVWLPLLTGQSFASHPPFPQIRVAPLSPSSIKPM
jgi:hypothetical protein